MEGHESNYCPQQSKTANLAKSELAVQSVSRTHTLFFLYSEVRSCVKVEVDVLGSRP